MRGRQNCINIQRFEHICTTLSGFLFRDLRCCRVYLRLLYQLKCLLESALADVYHFLPAPHFLRSWKGYWRFGEWMRGDIQDFQEISTRRLQSRISKERLCTAGQMDGVGGRPESKSKIRNQVKALPKWTWYKTKLDFKQMEMQYSENNASLVWEPGEPLLGQPFQGLGKRREVRSVPGQLTMIKMIKCMMTMTMLMP